MINTDIFFWATNFLGFEITNSIYTMGCDNMGCISNLNRGAMNSQSAVAKALAMLNVFLGTRNTSIWLRRELCQVADDLSKNKMNIHPRVPNTKLRILDGTPHLEIPMNWNIIRIFLNIHRDTVEYFKGKRRN